MIDVIPELHNALEMNDSVILAFDVFIVSVNFLEVVRKCQTEVLLIFYGRCQL